MRVQVVSMDRSAVRCMSRCGCRPASAAAPSAATTPTGRLELTRSAPLPFSFVILMHSERKVDDLSGSRIQRWVMAKEPKGTLDPSHFKLEQAESILVRPSHISVDPYLRGWAMGHLSVGSPMTSGMVGRVAQSKHPQYSEGDQVFCYANWATLALADPNDPKAQVFKLPDHKDVPPTAYLGCLGMPGATAYFGLKDAAPFKKNDIVLVSGAAGAVGSMVSQLSKLWGAKRVIGSVRGETKRQVTIDKFACHECIDITKYETHEKASEQLKHVCPDGVDLFWDGTGGPLSWAFYDHPRKFARVALCGQISEYEKDKPSLIPNPFKNCIFTSVKIQGDYYDRWSEFLSEVTPLVRSGRIRYEETVMDGFDKLPHALEGLFKGVNVGKMIVKVTE